MLAFISWRTEAEIHDEMIFVVFLSLRGDKEMKNGGCIAYYLMMVSNIKPLIDRCFHKF